MKSSGINLLVIDTVVDGCVEISTMVLNYVLIAFSTYFVAEGSDSHLQRRIIALLSFHCVSMNCLQLSVVGVVVVCHSCRITFYKTHYTQ